MPMPSTSHAATRQMRAVRERQQQQARREDHVRDRQQAASAERVDEVADARTEQAGDDSAPDSAPKM